MPLEITFYEEVVIRTAAGLSNDGLVRGDLDLGGPRDGSADDDDGRAAGSDSGRELGQCRHSSGGASAAASGSENKA